MTFIIGTPHAKGSGYYNSRYSADSRVVEDHIHTCSHCQAVIKMSEWKEAGGWCGKCEKPLCDHPDCMAETALKGCIPFIKKIESFMENTVKLEQHLRIAGLEPSPAPAALILP